MEKFDQINPEVANLNEQERRQRVEFFLREEIADDFDLNNEDLKSSLESIGRGDLYLQQRDNWVNLKMEIYHETEDINQVAEAARQEAKEAKINKVTGLVNRAGLYETMNYNFKKIFGESNLKDREKFMEALKNGDFSKKNLSVAVADASFLSYANEVGGHEMGDQLLKAMAGTIKQEGERAVHLGGDEMAVIYSDQDVEDSIERIHEGVDNLEIGFLKQVGLKPNLDIGTAKLSEAVEVFNELIGELEETIEGREALKIFNPVKGLQNILKAIADKRSFLEKGRVRIPLLLEIKSSSQEKFNQVIGSFRKGGYSVTDEELYNFQNMPADDRNEAIRDFIIKKEESRLQELENKFDQIRSRLILKKALEKF